MSNSLKALGGKRKSSAEVIYDNLGDNVSYRKEQPKI